MNENKLLSGLKSGTDPESEMPEEQGDLSVYEEPPKPPEKLPRWSIALYIAAGAALIIYIITYISPAFADFFCRYVASGFRAILAYATSWIPFSLGEACVFLLPVILVLLISYTVNKYCETWKDLVTGLLMVGSIAAAAFFMFVFTLGTGYRGTTLDEKMDLERRDCSAQDLYSTALILREKLGEELDNICYGDDNFSVMPYNYNEMSKRIIRAYDSVCDEYGFVQRLHSRIKPIVHSEPWTYTHTTGVYIPFTGESNININMPDYTVPYTAAHEFAHQRGIAREDEANFVAFLACIASDDPYIRYSGYLSMYEYVSNALYSADYDLWLSAREEVPAEVLKEMSAYNRFFEKYRKNVIATVSNKVNDAYLRSQGTKGSVSYGLVIDLAVAYYAQNEEIPG